MAEQSTSAFEKWLNSTVPGYREAWDAALEEAAKIAETKDGDLSGGLQRAMHIANAIRELKEQK